MVIVLIGLFLGAVAINRGMANDASGIVVVAVVALVLLVASILRANLWWRSPRSPSSANESVNTFVAYGSLTALVFVAIASFFVG